MKKINRKTTLYTSLVIMFAIWGFIAVEKGTNLFKGLDLIIFILIISMGIFFFLKSRKRDKEILQGIPAEDELTQNIKFKAGYHAYMWSMYMWLFIFIFKDKFPDVETMLGGGILLSALLALIARVYVKKKFYEEQN